jgi:hypothetical protein
MNVSINDIKEMAIQHDIVLSDEQIQSVLRDYNIIVMYNQHTNYIKDKNKIKELEEKLDEYYTRRENKLLKKFRDIEQ